MSLTLLSNPQKTIIICTDDLSFFESDVSELDFRWTLANQQSATKNITVTNVGVTSGTILSISLPTGFFTTQTFPQTVLVGASVVIPIYFLAVSSADYSANTSINANTNTVVVSLLGGVQSKALKFDGVNDYVISTQDVNWEISQAWTFFASSKNVNWNTNDKNDLFANYVSASQKGIILGGGSGSNFFSILFYSSLALVYRIAYTRSAIASNSIIQITYSGTPNLLASINMYVNGALFTTGKTLSNFNFSGTLIASGQKAQIGFPPTTIIGANSLVQEVSFVNYVKSGAELTADYNAGYQSKGSGDYLFRQSFNVGGTPLALKADVLGGLQVDTNIIGQTTADFVNF